MSAIYVGTIPLLILCKEYNFCWCLLTDRLLQLHSLNSLTNDTGFFRPVYNKGHFVLYLL